MRTPDQRRRRNALERKSRAPLRGGIPCPRCGHPCRGERGLKLHLHRHEEAA